MELPDYLKEIYETGVLKDLEGNERALNSSVSKAEAETLMRMVVDSKATNTLETGVAFGSSTMAMCHALKSQAGESKRHYGVDPNQNSEYGGAALASLKKEGLDHLFELLEGPSHLMLPELINKNVTLDCAFVDGWHTFDYTLLDFFLIDKMLKPGGLIGFHDMYALSKQKVLRYILSHRDYEVAKEYRITGGESLMTTLKFFVWRIYKKPALLFSWFNWTYNTRSSSGLIVLRKKNNFEPVFDFFKNF